MSSKEHPNHAHTVVVSAGYFYNQLCSAFTAIKPDYGNDHHDFMNALFIRLIEACQVRECAETNIQVVAGQVECMLREHMSDFDEKKALVHHAVSLVIRLGDSILYQLDVMHLYDNNGHLMYTHRPVVNETFKEIALDYIQRLSWNKEFYEPVSYRRIYEG